MEHRTIDPTEYSQPIAQIRQQPQLERKDQTAPPDARARGRQSKWQRFVEIFNRFCAIWLSLFHPLDEDVRYRRVVEAYMEARQ